MQLSTPTGDAMNPRPPDSRLIQSEPSGSALERIAQVLGCTIDALRDPASPEGATAELLDLWLRIESPGERRQLLDFVRGLVPRG